LLTRKSMFSNWLAVADSALNTMEEAQSAKPTHKVTRVDDNYLLINETLPDGLGCWNQRNVKLALK
ncbi:hypothetical protein QBX67_28100, partial [Bacillus sp. LS15-K4]|nr:hypothetical protein [Bacillus sp. LS15-K4]